MLNVTIGNNVDRKRIIVDENKTIREVLEENDIDYSRGATMLDGATLRAGELDSTFADMGITTRCSLFNVAKTNNA